MTVVTIKEAQDFATVRANVRRVSEALDQRALGEAIVARMDARLAASAGAWRGRRAFYLTPGGVTAGPGTLMNAILTGAGLVNAEARPGFHSVSLESLAMMPPKAVVLGFFDTMQVTGDSFGIGGRQVVKSLVRESAIATLPGALLGCPDWGAAEATARLAAFAPR